MAAPAKFKSTFTVDHRSATGKLQVRVFLDNLQLNRPSSGGLVSLFMLLTLSRKVSLTSKATLTNLSSQARPLGSL